MMRFSFLMILFFSSSLCLAQIGYHDLVIDEIMADPSPPALTAGGLPELEYIELKNVSGRSQNLNGLRIMDASSTGTINNNFILQADSFVVVCATGSVGRFAPLGATVGVTNFPSLDNDGEILSLRSKEGKTIFALEYSSSWYRNVVKSDGGWSMEMIDPRNYCGGNGNWTASIHPQGGTPGRRNSVDGINRDELSPVLQHAFATDSLHIVLVFDESLDSLTAASATNFTVSDNIGIPSGASPFAPLFKTVLLTLKLPLIHDKIYVASARNITDCSGNNNGSGSSTKVGLPSTAEVSGVVFNEILFNPKPDGVDYIEIYNRGRQIIDLKTLLVAGIGSVGSPTSLKKLVATSRLIFPGDYFVITENAMAVQRQYVSKNNSNYLEISMPSLPDDRGHIAIYNETGLVIDELAYDEKWQFRLIDNKEGVALEKVDYNKPTQDPLNWNSASSDAGYGTPSYQNSQFSNNPSGDGSISVSPKTFSPDNDGYDDFLTVNYHFTEPGYSCTITLFDVNGRVVRLLCQNAICGSAGYFRWDGLNEKGQALNAGVYILLAEAFSLSGKIEKFRQAIVLAKRFN